VSISIIMPAFKLEGIIFDNILKVIKVVKELTSSYEIIIIDDGSPDNTYDAAIKASELDNRVIVLRHSENRGKGQAFITGYKHSRGDVIVLLDADLDIPPQQMILLLKALEEADIAITDKWHPQSKILTTTKRRIVSRVFNLLTRILVGLKFRDTQTGCKAFRREALENIIPLLTVKGYAFDVELLLAAKEQGYKVAEVPAYHTIKLKGEVNLKGTLSMLADLLRIAYNHRVRKLYSIKKHNPSSTLKHTRSFNISGA